VTRFQILFVIACSCAHCAVITDLPSFLAQTGPNSVATFDDVPAGTASPFTSAGATFTDSSGGVVLNTLVGLGHSFWFGSAGSLPNFYGTLLTYSITLPRDASAFGFLMACFGCDPVNDSQFSWTLRSATGDVVGSGSTIVDLSVGSEGDPRFLGVTSPVSFRSIEITKNLVDNPRNEGGTYVIDDFRFAQAIPEPSSLVLIGSAFAALSAIRSRSRRGLPRAVHIVTSCRASRSTLVTGS
jgi:hypothetical protein